MELYQLSRSMLQVLFWLSGDFSFSITFPANEVFESATEKFRVSYVVHFIFLFTLNCNRVRRRQLKAIDFHIMSQKIGIGHVKAHMQKCCATWQSPRGHI